MTDPEGENQHDDGEVTRLLIEAENGDPSATEKLLPLVYDRLHAIARNAFRDQNGRHTLQPTVIVHDAYMKLLEHAGNWNDRGHFYVVAAKAMRQMLADHARARGARKRGGDWQRVSLVDARLGGGGEELDLVQLDEALEQLSALSPRQAQVVELRFLAGLEVGEVAEILSISQRTVVSEWRMARAFLRARIHED